jgi:hypothetical protein
VKTGIQALIAAVVGGALVWAMFWLVESVLPASIFLPLETSRLLILVAAVAAAATIGRRWRIVTAAVLLAGAGFAWTLHEIDPLALCQSDALFRPCTTREITWMVMPPIVVLLFAAGTALTARRQTGHGQPARG